MTVDELLRRIQNTDAERALLSLTQGTDGRPRTQMLFDDFGEGYAWELVGDLEELGLVGTRTLDGSFSLTGKGETVAQRLQTSLDSGPRRAAAVRRLILETVANSSQSALDFDKPPAEIVNHQLAPTADEMREAIEWLKDSNLIRVMAAWGKDLPNGLTSAGKDALLNNRLLLTDHDQQATITHDNRNQVNMSGGNVAGGLQGGEGNTQHITLTGTQAAELTQILRAALDAAEQTGDSDLEESITDALALTEGAEPKSSMIRTAVTKALTTATNTIATEAGQSAIKFLTQALSTIS